MFCDMVGAEKKEAKDKQLKIQSQPEPSPVTEHAVGPAETTNAAPATVGADDGQQDTSTAPATGGAETTDTTPTTIGNNPNHTEGASEPSPATGGDAPATGGDAPADDTSNGLFEVGTAVRTTANKHKDKLDNQEGEVVALLTHHYKVKLLTGTSKGETVKLPHDKVTLLQPPPIATESTTGGAAGSDATPSNAGSHGGAAGAEQANDADQRSEDFESLQHLFVA